MISSVDKIDGMENCERGKALTLNLATNFGFVQAIPATCLSVILVKMCSQLLEALMKWFS